MSVATPSNCSCPTPVVTEIPGVQGVPGANGADGVNGVNAYTTTSQALVIPTTGSSVEVSVASNSWMAIGQQVFVSDGTNLANFQVLAIQVSPPTATLKALGNTGDSAAAVTIASGASVVPAGVQGVAAFVPVATQNAATGGSQALTATPAQALSTTLTLSGSAGKTYLLMVRLRLDYVGATFAASREVTLSIRRTNNTPANLVSVSLATAVITTLTHSMGEITAVVPYTTVGASDVVQPYASIAVIPSAGALNIVEASITSLQLT